jgi:hypothetical protein
MILHFFLNRWRTAEVIIGMSSGADAGSKSPEITTVEPSGTPRSR